MELEGRRIEVRGTVQGVGFRPWLYRVAHEEGVSGRVRNDVSGVTIEAFGSSAALAAFLRRIETDRPPAAEVREVRARAIPPEQAQGFEIVASEVTGERRVSIPADLASCPECLAELRDPRDRRYRYAFTNCTHCGPRYTIARDVPYDRPSTTMAGFAMCARCLHEYEDPADRRFHAQPNACPACGPQLRLLAPPSDGAPASPDGRTASAFPPLIAQADAAHRDPVIAAAEALREGRIVAVKGLGGYHLACDAGSPSAVRRLRERKRRDEKPFAVMVRDLEAARELAALSKSEEQLLVAIERPIVLVQRRADAALAPEVAPGNPLVGILLAYTPLHDLLLEAFAGPLVMTSGNLSEEPMAAEDGEALARLGGIADLFLTHDRAIENRCDDSVARVIAGRPTLLRRSRGYVPRAITLVRPVARPILACGAQLKNAFCLAAGDEAWLGPHIGELDNLEAARAFEEQVERLQRFLGIRPEVIAHDLHPDHVSTGYARRRPEPTKIAVQHHHAHVASALAEHGIAGPALGLAWDGTGYGTDGTAWGGELLLVEGASFERLATLRPIRLAGSDEAIRQVWRIALAALDDAFDGAPPLERLRLFDSVPDRDRAVVRQMLAKGLNAPLAHGAGRYFDAIGALGLARPRASYEGQVALEWNLALDDSETGNYPFEMQMGSGCPQADLRPLVRAAALDVAERVAAAVVSARFHNAMADVAVALVRRAAGGRARLPVVLTGGCFQNAELVERIERRLAGERAILRHGLVPPGDGGVALGQVLVADALLATAGGSGA
jgi:hydrogenase maturation protein HypF